MSALPKTLVIGATQFTRPADTTAYASGDLVANSTTAGSVVALSFANVTLQTGYKARIKRIGLKSSGTAVTNGSFRIHLFDGGTVPTVANGDNGAIAIATNIVGYLGSMDIAYTLAGAAGAMGWSAAGEINFSSVSSKNLSGLIEARGAYTPASAETFNAYIEVDRL